MRGDRSSSNHLTLAVELVSAYVSGNSLPPDELPSLLRTVHLLVKSAASETNRAIESSVSNEHITCLECSKKFRSLARHIATCHDLSSQQYREKWSLPRHYPMVAPAYAAACAQFAKTSGLGRSIESSRTAKRGFRKGA